MPQDPNDQPASELLKEIAAEKARLIKSGVFREQEEFRTAKQIEHKQLPNNWSLTTVQKLGFLCGGKRLPKGHTYSETPSEHRYLTVTNMKDQTIIDNEVKYISDETFNEIKKYIITKDDLYITIAGTIGVVGTIPESCDGMNLTENAARFVFFKCDKRFLVYLLNSYSVQQQFMNLTNTLAQPKLSLRSIQSTEIGIPPLKEQKRIVARIEQLMGRCDELERLRAERDKMRLDTHAAAINQLLSAADSENFSSAWRFITSNFAELYSVKENVAELRKTILQLAVMGKLVPQDPNDQPASELLKEIAAEKARLMKEKKIKKAKHLSLASPKEMPFQVPDSWQWSRIVELAESIDYGTSQKTCDDSSLVPVYRMGNIVDGKLIDEGFKYIAPDIDELPYLYLHPNDILFNRTNSYELVGKSAIFTGPAEYTTFASYLIRIRLFAALKNPAFISMAMNAPYFRLTQIEPEIVQQCGQANFNGTKLSLCLVPLPPISEQKRIVTRVDQLMALCDNLEQNITAAADSRSTLLNALMANV
mgnify:CR=1 FL=1